MKRIEPEAASISALFTTATPATQFGALHQRFTVYTDIFKKRRKYPDRKAWWDF